MKIAPQNEEQWAALPLHYLFGAIAVTGDA